MIKKINNFLNVKNIRNRPLSLWIVLVILGFWTIAKAADYIMFFLGLAAIPEIVSGAIIIPVNIYCIAGIWTYNKKIYEASKYWLWLSYVIAVFILPGYTSIIHEKRAEIRLLMAIIMSPILIAWIILRFSSLRSKFEQNKGKDVF